jgi:hypothetical protein
MGVIRMWRRVACVCVCVIGEGGKREEKEETGLRGGEMEVATW